MVSSFILYNYFYTLTIKCDVIWRWLDAVLRLYNEGLNLIDDVSLATERLLYSVFCLRLVTLQTKQEVIVNYGFSVQPPDGDDASWIIAIQH